jgi:hypothetical protein
VQLFGEDSLEYEYELRRQVSATREHTSTLCAQVRLRHRFNDVDKCAWMRKAVHTTATMYGVQMARSHFRVYFNADIADECITMLTNCALVD